MKINNFQGDQTDISAKKEALYVIVVGNHIMERVWRHSGSDPQKHAIIKRFSSPKFHLHFFTSSPDPPECCTKPAFARGMLAKYIQGHPENYLFLS